MIDFIFLKKCLGRFGPKNGVFWTLWINFGLAFTDFLYRDFDGKQYKS